MLNSPNQTMQGHILEGVRVEIVCARDWGKIRLLRALGRLGQRVLSGGGNARQDSQQQGEHGVDVSVSLSDSWTSPCHLISVTAAQHDGSTARDPFGEANATPLFAHLTQFGDIPDAKLPTITLGQTVHALFPFTFSSVSHQHESSPKW